MISQNLQMVGGYDYGLVALSIGIAVLASWTALDLAGRIKKMWLIVIAEFLPGWDGEIGIKRQPHHKRGYV